MKRKGEGLNRPYFIMVKNDIKKALKKQIYDNKPRCSVCGKFFGLKEILNDEIITIIKEDNHFQSENQWYEHKKCRL